MSQTTVSKIWRAFGLKPHLADSFKLSPDPQFIDKVRDVVGLYLNPPERAVVLCVNEAEPRERAQQVRIRGQQIGQHHDRLVPTSRLPLELGQRHAALHAQAVDPAGEHRAQLPREHQAQGLVEPRQPERVARMQTNRAYLELLTLAETIGPEGVAVDKRASFATEPYWGRPVAGWGDPHPRVLVVGLAPAANGGNRTGRIFTGDRSGDWLFASLHRVGLAVQATSVHAGDGQRLLGTRMAATVRCAPPDNKPTVEERDTCAPWLLKEVSFVADSLRAQRRGAFFNLRMGDRLFRDT